MARQAVHAMQSQMLREIIQPEEPLQRRVLHPLYIAETHVVFYQRGNLRRLLIREAEPTANVLGNLYSNLHMAVEANPTRPRLESRRLAHVVQQSTPCQGRRCARRQLPEQHQCVRPDVTFGMKLRRLLDSVQAINLRKHLPQHLRSIQQFKRLSGMPLRQHSRQFVAHALATHLMQLRGVGPHSRFRTRLNCKFESRRKTNSAKHAQLVFLKSLFGVPDRANELRVQVLAPAHKIKHSLHLRIKQHSINSEVAPDHIFFGPVGKPHRVGPAAIGIRPVAAERSYFRHNLAPIQLVAHQDHSKMRADSEGPWKQLYHPLRTRTGCHIEICRRVAQQQVAHASSGKISLMTACAQALYDAFSRDLGKGLFHLSTIENGMRDVLKRGLILGIESSCDETAAAVVGLGAETLSNVVASQIATHSRYGGVVPELASREHLRNIVPVVRAALRQAQIGFGDLAAIAITEGPGLAGALLVGISYAKALAFSLNKPLIAVNHLEGHIHAVLLEHCRRPEPLALPALALVVSGGHTHLYLARHNGGVWTYRNVGRTLDDAAGEAFDKVAKLLGLGYPGGPWIDALAPHGNPNAVPFSFAQVKPKAHRKDAAAATEASTFFSFSGIKTAVLRYTQLHGMHAAIEERRSKLVELPGMRASEALPFFDRKTLDLIASFQRAVVDDLRRKTFRAAESFGAASLIVSGGVAANRELRVRFTAEAAEHGLPIAFPSLALSTDNAAMIAAAAWPKFQSGEFAAEALSADPALALGR